MELCADASWATAKRGRGRFSPKVPVAARDDDPATSYGEWIGAEINRLAGASDVEINVLTCEFVVRSEKLKLLEDEFTARSDFAECFGDAAGREVQCAEIQSSAMRRLRRCVGLRCDVALWAPAPATTSSESAALVAATTSSGLTRSSWIASVIALDGSGASWGSVVSETAGSCVLAGRLDKTRACRGVVTREPPSVHVLAKCLHGRREGWTSVFASDASRGGAVTKLQGAFFVRSVGDSASQNVGEI